MSLKALINSAAQSGLKICGDLRTEATLLLNPVKVFIAGKNVITYTEETVLGLKTQYDLNEIVNSRGSISVTDVKFIVSYGDIVNTISVDSKVRINNIEYVIAPSAGAIKVDPSRSIYVFQLRA